jgi:hypothetical protein
MFKNKKVKGCYLGNVGKSVKKEPYLFGYFFNSLIFALLKQLSD